MKAYLVVRKNDDQVMAFYKEELDAIKHIRLTHPKMHEYTIKQIEVEDVEKEESQTC